MTQNFAAKFTIKIIKKVNFRKKCSLTVFVNTDPPSYKESPF